MRMVFVTFPKQYSTEKQADGLEIVHDGWMAELAKKQAKLNRYKAMLGQKKWYILEVKDQNCLKCFVYYRMTTTFFKNLAIDQEDVVYPAGIDGTLIDEGKGYFMVMR